MTEPTAAADGRTVTVRVPISIRKRGGRKLVLAPDGTNVTTALVRRHIDNAMVKAIARAFRWREMLENHKYATITEIAFEICDQYTLQADAFARAILNDTPVPTPLADAVGNMRTIEALLASARSGTWLTP